MKPSLMFPVSEALALCPRIYQELRWPGCPQPWHSVALTPLLLREERSGALGNGVGRTGRRVPLHRGVREDLKVVAAGRRLVAPEVHVREAVRSEELEAERLRGCQRRLAQVWATGGGGGPQRQATHLVPADREDVEADLAANGVLEAVVWEASLEGVGVGRQ